MPISQTQTLEQTRERSVVQGLSLICELWCRNTGTLYQAQLYGVMLKVGLLPETRVPPVPQFPLGVPDPPSEPGVQPL